MRNIPVIHEDEWLCIIDKPSGLLTIPDPGRQSLCVTDILNNALKEKQVSWRLHPCHRLDRDTSGLLVYAKGKSIQKKMMDKFRAHGVKKFYIAFVQGRLVNYKGQIKNPVDGQFACTEYRVTGRHRDFTVVEAYPLTGRKNQLRIHFKQLGYPIVGEDKFAFRRDFPLRCNRLCLHAAKLEFTHPATNQPVMVQSPLPPALTDFLKGHP